MIVPLSLLLFTSCSTADKMTKVHPGMTKQEVINELGSPKGSKVVGDKEYLNYYFFDSVSSSMNGAPRGYAVRLNKGVVETHGRLGDVD